MNEYTKISGPNFGKSVWYNVVIKPCFFWENENRKFHAKMFFASQTFVGYNKLSDHIRLDFMRNACVHRTFSLPFSKKGNRTLKFTYKFLLCEYENAHCPY